jgi:hypothetical protein
MDPDGMVTGRDADLYGTIILSATKWLISYFLLSHVGD